MKTEIVKTEQNDQDIDWSKPMLVKSKLTNLVVLVTNDIDSFIFKGTVIIPDENHSFGCAMTNWYKKSFTPITEPITIKFTP